MRPKIGYLAPGVLLILLGVFLPREWYDALPRNPGLPSPPIDGMTLLQVSFVIEGLAVVWFSLKRWSYTRLSEAALPLVTATSEEQEVAGRRMAIWTLVAITMLALFFRLYRINADLWLDEISPILDYGHLSVLEVIGTFISTNNHLLNTLLVNLSIGLFGEGEWAIRLPAVLFGVATIPVVYWIGRQLGLPRIACLGVALMLAVSYHHIFFSQNARGYSGHVLFSLLSSGLLVRGLQTDRGWTWVLYIVVMFLNFASILVSAFVFGAHLLVGGAALLAARRRGAPVLPLLRRLTVVFVVAAFLSFQIYALVLPTAYVVAQTAYTGAASGFAPFSGDLIRELVRGISAGFGGRADWQVLPALAAALLVAGAGVITLLRDRRSLSLALILPGLLMALFLVAFGLSFSPRFFLLALPVGILAAVKGVYVLAQRAGVILGAKRNVFVPGLATAALVLLVSAVSLVSLGYYYSIPKQPYRASLQYLEAERNDGEIVIVVDIAEKGFRYYGGRLGVKEDQDYFFVRSLTDLETVLASRGDEQSWVVTTFPRALHLRYPELEARIAEGWTKIRIFPATIGDGQISVWARRQP